MDADFTKLEKDLNVSVNEIMDKDILELLGVQGMSEEQKDQFYKDMLETVHRRVLSRIDKLITDEDAAEWKTIVEAKDAEGYKKFLKDHDINLDELYTEETLLYKFEMVSMVKAMQATKATFNG